MPNSTLRKSRSRPSSLELLTIILLFGAISIPRFISLDRYVTIDESKWVSRSVNFYRALSRGEFADTFQRGHPGVTAMWAGTAGLLWRFPSYAEEVTNAVEYREFDTALPALGHQPIELLEADRAFMVLFNSIVLILAFTFARRLLGMTASVVGILLIAFDPYHVAHTRLLHLDGLSGSLLLLSVLAYVSYLSGSRRYDLLVSGVAGGLGLLTKSPNTFLIPAIGLLALHDLWRKAKTRSDTPVAQSLRQTTVSLIVWGVAAAATFIIAWPAMWVDPFETIRQVAALALGSAQRGHASAVFFNGANFSDGRIGAYVYSFYPLNYLWRSTPVTVIGLVPALVAFAVRYNPLDKSDTRRTVGACLLFAVVFTLLMNLGSKKGDRYLLQVFAPLDLVAAVGWVATAKWATKTASPSLQRALFFLVVGAMVLAQAAGTMRVAPYYLSYYNPLMGGPVKAPEVLAIGWGEGLDQAARYLNAKPDASRLRVASWYASAFSPFFSGETLSVSSQIDDGRYEAILASDYAVIYIHQWQRQLPKRLLEYVSPLSPEKVIYLNGIEYAQIYKMPDRP